MIGQMLEKDPRRRPSAERILLNVERVVPKTFRGMAIVQRIRGQFRHNPSNSLGLLRTIHFPRSRERRDNEKEASSYLPSPSFSRDHSLDELCDISTSMATPAMKLSRDHVKPIHGKTLKKGVSLYANGGKENAGLYFKKSKEKISRTKLDKLPQLKKKTFIK